MGIIYKILSPSNGIYIGQTQYTEHERWNEHCVNAYNINSRDYNTLLCKAIRKYGKDNFNREIIETNVPIMELDFLEQYWIAYYHSFYKDNPSGYNMTRGGQGRTTITRDYEMIIDAWNQGKTLTTLATEFQCHVRTMSRILHLLGITTDELIQRSVALTQLEKAKIHPSCVDIYNIWKQGYSLTDMENIVKTDRHTIRHILTIVYNITDDDIIKRTSQVISKKKMIPILQYDLNDNFIREWESAQTASQALSIDFSSIRKCATGKRKTAGGYKWKNKENNND